MRLKRATARTKTVSVRSGRRRNVHYDRTCGILRSPRFVSVSDKARAVGQVSGKTLGTRFAQPADGPGGNRRVRRARPAVPVANVRHGPGRRARLGRVDRTADDGRVRLSGHARTRGGRRNRAQSQDRGVHGPEEAAVAVRRRRECPRFSARVVDGVFRGGGGGVYI